MKSMENLDSGYWISSHFEDFEKNMIDSMMDKLILCGRVPLIEDLEEYNSLQKKINILINKFYFGDELSDFEREIERLYLMLKQ